MIKSISEYLTEVNKILIKFNLTNTTTTPWFRGQSNKDWELTPSIYRYKDLVHYERDINRDFKLLSQTLISNNYPENEFEWLHLMQHYDLPTRLLDWTESSLVGLYFAVADLSSNDCSAVWVLSPRVYNWLILKDTNTVPIANSPYLEKYILKPDNGPAPTRKVEAEFPLAMRPAKNSKRILAQRGVFTIHGNKNICLANHLKSINISGNSLLEKIIIDKQYKHSILQELYQSGISPSVLFPELPGVSKELIMKYTSFYTHQSTYI